MDKIEGFIKDWFIDLDPGKIPSSYFIIRKTLLGAVSELKPKLKGNVLDLGCGIMPYKEFLNSSAIDNYIGVDLYEPTSYQNLVKPDLFWDGVTIPIEDSSCDFVIVTEFLEHYYDTNHILLEIKRVLKRNLTIPRIKKSRIDFFFSEGIFSNHKDKIRETATCNPPRAFISQSEYPQSRKC